jgi:hypothetical protein
MYFGVHPGYRFCRYRAYGNNQQYGYSLPRRQ